MTNTTHESSPPTNKPPQSELEARINTRRAELIAVLVEIKADTRIETAVVRDKLKARLTELSHIIKGGIVDGWTNLGETVTHKLDLWLAESAQQLPAPVAAAKTPGFAKVGQS